MPKMKYIGVLLLVALLTLTACNIPTPTAAVPVATDTAASTATEAIESPTDTPAATEPPAATETSAPPPVTDTPEPQTDARPLTVTTQTIYEESQEPPMVMDIEYPEFSDANGQPVEGLNVLVDELVDRQISEFQAMVNDIEPVEDTAAGPHGLHIRYEVRHNDGGLVSIYFQLSTYSRGAAHPLPFSETLTYDVAQNRAVQLGDLFQPGVDYLTVLSQRSIEDLTNQGVLSWDDGAQPLPENFKSWNVITEGLHITFDPYAVSPYALGYQNVVLPWDSLTEILNVDLPYLP